MSTTWPAAAAPGVEDRHQQPARAVDGGPALGQRHRDRQRRAVREPGHELHAGEGLRDAVVAALAGQRPGLPERRDAQRDEPRVAALERLRREPGRLEPARAQVLDQRVGGGQQPRQPRLGRERLELGLHRVLAAVLRLERERVLPVEAGPPLPHRRAVARLDLDDGGPEIGEEPARQLAGRGPGQLDDHDPGERAAAAGVRKPERLGHGRLRRSPKTRAALP